MRIRVVTLFPDYFALPLKQSLLGKAIDKGLVTVDVVDLRTFALDKHRTVDDTPFGGGGGMVMKIEPLDLCLKELGHERKGSQVNPNSSRIILTSAGGATFDQRKAITYSLESDITIICGHYLGVDERLVTLYDVDEVSIGDYVLTGGEPAALVLIDAVTRLIPQVLGNFESALNDSFMDEIVGTPCYTRPAIYDGHEVPAPLMSGNHLEIQKYRRRAAIRKSIQNRPDLVERAELTADEARFVEELSRADKPNAKNNC